MIAVHFVAFVLIASFRESMIEDSYGEDHTESRFDAAVTEDGPSQGQKENYLTIQPKVCIQARQDS